MYNKDKIPTMDKIRSEIEKYSVNGFYDYNSPKIGGIVWVYLAVKVTTKFAFIASPYMYVTPLLARVKL